MSGLTNTEPPVNAPGFHVIGLIFDVAVKLKLFPAQIVESNRAVNVGKGVTATFTVSLRIPHALDTCAI